MDLEYNGLYRFIELDTLTLPTTIEELEDASFVLDALFKLKVNNYLVKISLAYDIFIFFF
jgi:hypothetical protein